MSPGRAEAGVLFKIYYPGASIGFWVSIHAVLFNTPPKAGNTVPEDSRLHMYLYLVLEVAVVPRSLKIDFSGQMVKEKETLRQNTKQRASRKLTIFIQVI